MTVLAIKPFQNIHKVYILLHTGLWKESSIQPLTSFVWHKIRNISQNLHPSIHSNLPLWQVYDRAAFTLAHVMSREIFSQGGFPLPSPQFTIWSILLHWWSCFCFTGMVSAPHAEPTASTYWRNNWWYNSKHTESTRAYSQAWAVWDLLGYLQKGSVAKWFHWIHYHSYKKEGDKQRGVGMRQWS